jgi:hypothetical protein
LEDESAIHYSTTEDATYSDHLINLQQLLRLKTGHSWYEQFGFTNDAIQRRKDHIEAYTKQPIGTLYPDELIYRIQDYLEDDTTDITRGRTISNIVSDLYTVLNTVCPNRICPNDDDLAVVDDINHIINEMYQGMLSWVGITQEHFHNLQLDLSPPKQKGSSRTRRKRARKARAAHRRRTRRM